MYAIMQVMILRMWKQDWNFGRKQLHAQSDYAAEMKA